MTQDQPIRLLVHGASGRMGRAVVRLAAAASAARDAAPTCAT